MTYFKLLLLLLSVLCFSVLADQQSNKDSGVDYGRALLDGVRNLATSTDPADTPGYEDPTTMPEYQYYDSQNVSGMQTDATVDLSTGTANDASNFAWGQSTVPKLQFNPATDPILTNAETISINAINNPGQITTTTGDCAIAQVSNTESRVEHCTAWMIPTQHTCDKTVNVDVTWEDTANCPTNSGYSEVTVQFASYTMSNLNNHYASARPFCDIDQPDNEIAFQVNATQPGYSAQDCTKYPSFTTSTNVPTSTYTGIELSPYFPSAGKCINAPMPVFHNGSCDTNGQCNYHFTFFQLTAWNPAWFQTGSSSPCYGGAPVNLSQFGYVAMPGGLESNGEYYYCAALPPAELDIVFAKAQGTNTPIVTETIDNQCAHLEAQLP